MIKKILLAVDGSEHALKAANYAQDIAIKGSQTQVTILYVAHIPTEMRNFIEGINTDLNLDKLMQKDAEPIFQKIISLFKAREVNYTTMIQNGSPADEIVLEAKTGNYDLIIVGSRGLGKLEGMFLGSVSDKVAHTAPCPVLIVK